MRGFIFKEVIYSSFSTRQPIKSLKIGQINHVWMTKTRRKAHDDAKSKPALEVLTSELSVLTTGWEQVRV